MSTRFIGLRRKILVGYLIIAGLPLLTSGWAIFNFHRLNLAVDNIMIASYRSVVASQNMIEALERQDSAELIFLFGHEKEGVTIFSTNQLEFKKWLAVAEGNITFPGETNSIRQIKANYQLYLAHYGKLHELTTRNQNTREYYINTVLPLFNKLKDECHTLLDINQEHMIKADKLARSDAQTAILSTSIVAIIALILALVFGYRLSNTIIGPTLRLTASAQRIGEGHLDEVIPAETSDEIGQLAAEFNRMSQRLREYEQYNINQLITEQRKSDAIVRSIPDPLIVVDAASRIIMMNSAAEKTFSIHEKQVCGQHILEVVADAPILAALQKCAQTRRPVTFTEMEQAVKLKIAGKSNFFLPEVTPVNDQDGNLLGIILFLGDVTHLKEVDQLKSDFVSAASHEFRTPLTTIMMGAGLLLEHTLGELNSGQEQLVVVIREDCERLSRLVKELLDLSRIESGKAAPVKTACRLSTVVAASVKPLQLQFEEHRIKLEITPDVAAAPLINVDPDRIVWVFNNLLANALHYTPAGGAITITSYIKRGKFYISIKDTGIGIPHEYQTKIFERFIRLENSNTSATGGTGLGLSIAREIIKAHGGRIWVESEPGRGSNFIFSLPLADV
jgi:NtrC-family two-component system sensor histidine kinase KinB